MESIAEKEKNIEEEFLLFDDWADRYQRIIELGEENPGLPEHLKTPERLVPGCVSRVWLVSEFKEGRLYFYADSDALITKGLISLLLQIFSGQKPEDIVKAELQFMEKIGLKKHLSPNRANGLANMVKKIKQEAQKYLNSN